MSLTQDLIRKIEPQIKNYTSSLDRDRKNRRVIAFHPPGKPQIGVWSHFDKVVLFEIKRHAGGSSSIACHEPCYSCSKMQEWNDAKAMAIILDAATYALDFKVSNMSAVFKGEPLFTIKKNLKNAILSDVKKNGMPKLQGPLLQLFQEIKKSYFAENDEELEKIREMFRPLRGKLTEQDILKLWREVETEQVMQS